MNVESEALVAARAAIANETPWLPAEPPPIVASTRPGRNQILAAAAFGLALIIVGIACTPCAGIPLMPIPGFMTAFGAGMLVINSLLATLLLSKGSIEKRADVLWLGTAYLFVAAIFVPLTLSFKDGFVPGVLIGTPASSVWLWSAWHGGFGLAISWYALHIDPTRVAPSVRMIIIAVLATVAFLAVMATAGVDYLPTLLWNGSTFFSGALYCIPVALIAINVVAFLLCLRLMARTAEQLWVTVALAAACFDLWLTVHGGNRFALGWYLSKCGSLLTSFVVIASLLRDITELYRNSSKANLILTDLANRDGMTGVRNRRFFDQILAMEWLKALGARTPVSLLMIDVDLFKSFNDHYGHVVGDDCLRDVASCLDEAVSRGIVCRYGGEEFVVLLPNTDAGRAVEIAELLRASVEGLAIPHKHNPHQVLTISVGAATRVPDGESMPHALLRKADSALYLAKRRGRNQAASSTELQRGPTAEVISLEQRMANS